MIAHLGARVDPPRGGVAGARLPAQRRVPPLPVPRLHRPDKSGARPPLYPSCHKYAVEQPWNGSRLRLCWIAARRIYRVFGVEHVRHRRPAAPEVVLLRLLSLDYLLEPSARRVAPDRGREG